MKKASEFFTTVFAISVTIALFAGGLAFFGFLASLIMGGTAGEAFAVAIQKKYFPYVIRLATISVFTGLVGMYLGKTHALSLITDKKEAQEEMKKLKDAAL